jgi:hypothetical protein
LIILIIVGNEYTLWSPKNILFPVIVTYLVRIRNSSVL